MRTFLKAPKRSSILLVLASRHDRNASALVEGWRLADAHLLTCEDLSKPGWIFHPGFPEKSRAIIDGQSVPFADIRGIVSLLPHVSEFELPQIVEEERPYVAAEMMAFLVAWLSSLDENLVNRPSPLNLSGPGWCRERWAREARLAGLTVHAECREASAYCSHDSTLPTFAPKASSKLIPVTICANECIVPNGIHMANRDLTALKALAANAQTRLLTSLFSSPGTERMIFAGVSTHPDLSDHRTADALLSHLTSRR